MYHSLRRLDSRKKYCLSPLSNSRPQQPLLDELTESRSSHAPNFLWWHGMLLRAVSSEAWSASRSIADVCWGLSILNLHQERQPVHAACHLHQPCCSSQRNRAKYILHGVVQRVQALLRTCSNEVVAMYGGDVAVKVPYRHRHCFHGCRF